MKPDQLNQLIAGKREWTEPLAPEESAHGFKGWYASKPNSTGWGRLVPTRQTQSTRGRAVPAPMP